MAYDRDDRRFGHSNDRQTPGGYPPDRGGYGTDRQDRGGDYRARGTGGYGPHDDRPDRYAAQGRGGDQDRGFFDRAGDEVRSWFGDDEAERRRRQDEMQAEREYRSHYGTSDQRPGRSPSFGGFGRDDHRDREQRGDWRHDARPDQQRGDQGYGYTPGPDRGRQETVPAGWNMRDERNDHDHGYRSWRDRQMDSFDRDYDEFRREHQSRFDTEFRAWRERRQGQRDLLARVQEHQEVVGSDGSHIGTIDHVRGDHILLTKTDEAAGGHHHSIPSAWIQSVEDKVTVDRTADQAKKHWRDEEHGAAGSPGAHDAEPRGRTNLDRSFSGTY